MNGAIAELGATVPSTGDKPSHDRVAISIVHDTIAGVNTICRLGEHTLPRP
jgi:hypothetical protein